MTEPDLIRFVNAQAQVYSRVVEELTDGRKRTHWIFFPQLAGLVALDAFGGRKEQAGEAI